MSELTKTFQETRQMRRYGKLEAYKSAEFKTASNNQVVPEEDITIKDVIAFAGIIGAGVIGMGIFLLALIWAIYLLAPL